MDVVSYKWGDQRLVMGGSARGLGGTSRER